MTLRKKGATMNRALLVGINKYKLPGADLKGCVNDVTNVRDVLLKYYGFAVKEIRVVTDDRATKANILKNLEWLLKNAKPEDRLLFHYSGHGSQVRDRDGDELKDRLDEILCPHDMDWEGTYITDDDLRTLFTPLPKGVNLEVLLDSCHSGTGTREAQAIAGLPPELAFQPRFLAPPIDIALQAEDDLPLHPIARSANPLNHVLFTGCRDTQTSADAYIKGTFNGAFTYYFCKHIRDAEGGITRADLLTRVRASLKFNGFSQVPQLECPRSERKKGILE